MGLLGLAPAVRARFPGLALRAAVLAGVEAAGIGAPGTGPGAAGSGAAGDAGLGPGAAAGEDVAWVRARRTLEGLKDDPLFRAYRDFYWQLGIDPTKLRPSGEALNRRVLQGKPLPAILAFVDAYNLASLRTGVPIAAFDAGRLEGGVELRFARPGEGFVSIGGDKREVLQGHELVLADAARVVAFYPHRDSDATKVTAATRDVLVVACGAPGVPGEALDEALALCLARTRAACGGRAVLQERVA